MVLILKGKSASGKDRTLNKIVEKYNFKPIISYTTRPMRGNETNHVDYHFITREEFLENLDNFLEYRSYKTCLNGIKDVWYYATPKVNVKDDNYVVILDEEGAKSFINYYKDDCFVVYIECDNDVRKERAKNRPSFDENEWIRRAIDDEKKFKDSYSTSNFIIDSTYKTIDEVAKGIVSAMNNI